MNCSVRYFTVRHFSVSNIALKENEIDPAVERLQTSQVVEAEQEIARSRVAIGVPNEELPFDLLPSRLAVGELIGPLQI